MIKKIDECDVIHAHALFCEVITTMHSLSNDATKTYQKQWTPDRLKAMSAVPENVLLAADQGDDVLSGFLFGVAPEGGVGTIIWLGVKPSYQRQGIGRQLVDEAIYQYQKLGCHKLKLFTESESALSFYQAIGFVKEGTHKNHWWNQRFWSLAKFIEG